MPSLSLGLLVAFFASSTLAASSCHFANGTVLPDLADYNSFEPCTSGGPSTICCGLGRTNAAGGDPSKGDTKDECLPNGLCQNRVTKSGIESTSYWTDFCTNSDIDSSDCLNVCSQTRDGFGITALTPCTGRADSDRWCCGGSNDCCTSNVGVVLLAQVMGGSVSSSVTSSSTSSATSTASSAASSGASSGASSASTTASSAVASGTGASAATATSTGLGEAKKKSGLSGGAIAGIVIGALAGVALIGAALFFVWRRRAASKQQTVRPHYVEAPANPPQYPEHGYAAPGAEKYGQQNQGFAHNAAPTELPAAQPTELPANDYPRK